MSDPVAQTIRLGWTLAEVRGRTWRPRDEPAEPVIPDRPLGVLPLRSQRESAVSRDQAVGTLRRLVEDAKISDVAAPLDALDVPDPQPGDWPRHFETFEVLDEAIQDQLTRDHEDRATAYLVGRGLAECYWSYGDEREYGAGAGLGYLFSDERVRELTRMLGRLRSRTVDPLTPSAVAGSLEAWREVAATRNEQGVDKALREQIRRWYQLLVIGQDPTTLVTASRQLARRHYWLKALRTFWPQAVLALLALGSASTFFVSLGDRLGGLIDTLQPVLAAFGVGGLAVAGMLAKAQNAAQRVLTRAHQDAYTDLIAVSVTEVPDWVSQGTVETAVRRRTLTQATPALPT